MAAFMWLNALTPRSEIFIQNYQVRMPFISMSPIGECFVPSEVGDVSLKHVKDFMVMDNL